MQGPTKAPVFLHEVVNGGLDMLLAKSLEQKTGNEIKISYGSFKYHMGPFKIKGKKMKLEENKA